MAEKTEREDVTLFHQLPAVSFESKLESAYKSQLAENWKLQHKPN